MFTKGVLIIKVLKWIGIGIAGVLALLVILLFAGTKGSVLKGGVPLKGVSFTPGDIPDVPVYPGAMQNTESSGVAIPDDMRRVIGSNEDMWKRYRTGDSPEQVLAWYNQQIPEAGFNKGEPRDSGVVIFLRGDTRYALQVTRSGNQTDIILASGKE